jgi:iron(III) transport system ATP-binding protein
MTNPNGMIRMHAVSKCYDGRVFAVEQLALDLPHGSLVALLGPSGCGKTTTLRLLAGLERPDTGEIWLGEQCVASQRVWVAPEHRRVGMVFQDYALFPHLRVGENVAYPISHIPANQRRQRVQALLELVGLAGLTQRYPHQLSGGQQQRVALARALAADPLVVLLDEPFSNLDAALRKSTRAEVRRILKAAQISTLFVTHDQEEAFSVADLVVVMFGGKIAQIGTPRQIYLAPATREVAAFVGEASFLPAHANGDTAQTALGTVALAQPLHGTIEVLVRPEAVQLAPDPQGHWQVVQLEFGGAYQSLVVQDKTGIQLLVRTDPALELAVGDCVRATLAGVVCGWAIP